MTEEKKQENEAKRCKWCKDRTEGNEEFCERCSDLIEMAKKQNNGVIVMA